MQATRNKSNNYLVQGSILAAASIIVRLIGLMYRIPMNNIIGDEGMGYYGFAFEVYNIALILSSYSLPLAVSKLVAARQINHEYRNSYRVFLCAMCFALTIGLAAALIIFFGAEFFASFFYKDINIALPLKVLAPTIFIFSIMGVFRGFFQGKNTMIPTSISQVLEQIVNAVVSILAAFLLMRNYSAITEVAYYGAAGGTMGTLVGAFTGLLFLFFVFLIYKPVFDKKLRKDTSPNRETYGAIFKLLLITISPIILSQTVYHISGIIDGSLFARIMATKEVTLFDQVVLANHEPGLLYTKEIRGVFFGIYGNKYRLLTNVPVAIAAAFGAAIVPSIAAAKIKGQDLIIKNRIHWAIKLNMIIAIPSAVGLAVLASPILQLLFVHANEHALELTANFFRLGSIAIIFYALSTITNAILQGINQLRKPVIHAAISLGLHVILVFVLLNYANLSTYSLIIGNVTFPMVICILNWIAIAKHLDYQQEILKTFILPSVSALIMGVVTFFTYHGLYRLTGSNGVSTLISIVVAVVIFFLLLVLLKGVSEEEIGNLPKGYTIVRILKRIHLI